MAYSKNVWYDLPNTTTPMTANRLNNMENGIEANDLNKADKTTTIATLPLSGNISASDLATQLKTAMGNLMYPVGSIYMAVNNTNPSSLFGGTWVAWGSGKVPVGVDTNDSAFDTVEKTGGSKTVTLTENQMPKHRHHVVGSNIGSSSDTDSTHSIANYADRNQSDLPYSLRRGSDEPSNGRTSESGGGQAHDNLQPYITCYMWKRTA